MLQILVLWGATVKHRTGNGYELRCISCEAETDTKAEFTVMSDGLGAREESNMARSFLAF